MTATEGWIGVDLDGTLAHYDGWISVTHIGDPIPEMLERVIDWLENGKLVKIFTARVSHDATPQRIKEAEASRAAIEAWCEKHLGEALEVTCCKDFAMITLYDDRCVQVETNTGALL